MIFPILYFPQELVIFEMFIPLGSDVSFGPRCWGNLKYMVEGFSPTQKYKQVENYKLNASLLCDTLLLKTNGVLKITLQWSNLDRSLNRV